MAFLLQQNDIEIPITVAQLARLNPFAVTYRYDDMEIDAFRLSREEATKWLDSFRAWAKNKLDENSGASISENE